jgi:hypothetical protein
MDIHLLLVRVDQRETGTALGLALDPTTIVCVGLVRRLAD